MAERPILKSEREAKQAEAAQTPKRNVPSPIKKGDRKDKGESGEQQDPTQGHWTDNMDGRGKGGRKGGKGKGRGKGRGDARKAPVNPALMRGPRPSAKVEEPETPEPETPEVVAEETATDVVADTTAETGAEAVSASAETTTEAPPEDTSEDTAPEAVAETPADDNAETPA
ncbi:MAG: hypothetical protein AAF703_04895 [Cyanobacteria bacterium P01_D01_bin.105]